MSRKRHGASKKAARKPAMSEFERLARAGRTSIPWPIPGAKVYSQLDLTGNDPSSGVTYYNPLATSYHRSLQGPGPKQLIQGKNKGKP